MMRRIQRHVLAGLCGLVLCAHAMTVLAQMSVEVITLKHRTAEELVPILQPMLARDATVSGLRGQLVVRTTPANLREVRRILDSLDVAPRRLMITVAQAAGSDQGDRGADVSGTLRRDDQLRLTVPGAPPAARGRDGVQARVYDSRSMDNMRVVQSVQVVEGRSAFIQTGASVPVPQRRVVRSVVNGRPVDEMIESFEYRDADTGYHVTPRVTGDRVTLELSPQRESFVQRAPGVVEVQRVVSTVSGRLGEWIELAAVSQERSAEGSVLLGRAGSNRVETRSVVVKVDELR